MIIVGAKGEIGMAETATINEKQDGTVVAGKQNGNIESKPNVASLEEMSPPAYSQLNGFRNTSYVPEEDSVTKP